MVRRSYIHRSLVQADSLAGLRSKNRDVGLDALGVEDAGGQPQQRVNVAFGQQLAPDRLAGAALEQHVVGDNYGGAALVLEQQSNVLQEVQLLVAGGGPEVLAVHRQVLLLHVGSAGGDGQAGLAAKGRIGQHQS